MYEFSDVVYFARVMFGGESKDYLKGHFWRICLDFFPIAVDLYHQIGHNIQYTTNIQRFVYCWGVRELQTHFAKKVMEIEIIQNWI